MDTGKNSLRVLVMGGLGFMGSHLCRSLLTDGYQVRVFDKLYASRDLILDIENQIEIVEGDIAKSEDILQALESIDVAIHFIHTTVPGSSMQDPTYDVQSNVSSCTKWLPHIKETGLKRIIYISSGGTIYGVPKHNPIDEQHPTNPTCSYGITKLAIENYIRMYAQSSGIEYRICRPSNVYGEGQRLNIGQGVIGVFLDKALRGEPIEIWGDGTSKRDYLYVIDLINVLKILINHEGVGRTFNISTGIGYSLNDIINIIQKELRISLKVTYKPSRGFDVPVNILDSTRLKHETGWNPQTNITEGIRRVYNWLQKFGKT